MAFWNEALDIRHDDRVLYPETPNSCVLTSWGGGHGKGQASKLFMFCHTFCFTIYYIIEALYNFILTIWLNCHLAESTFIFKRKSDMGSGTNGVLGR